MSLFDQIKNYAIHFVMTKDMVIKFQENRIKLLEEKVETLKRSVDINKSLALKSNEVLDHELLTLKAQAALEVHRNKEVEDRIKLEVEGLEHSNQLMKESYEQKINELELIIMALQGNLGHPIPDGVELPIVDDNVLADQLKKQLDAAREVIERVEGGNKQTAYENMQCRSFLFDLEDFLLPNHPAKKMIQEFISHVGWNKR